MGFDTARHLNPTDLSIVLCPFLLQAHAIQTSLICWVPNPPWVFLPSLGGALPHNNTRQRPTSSPSRAAFSSRWRTPGYTQTPSPLFILQDLFKLLFPSLSFCLVLSTNFFNLVGTRPDLFLRLTLTALE